MTAMNEIAHWQQVAIYLADCLAASAATLAKRGGILLHDGSETGHLGLGLRQTNRTLRQAIDDAMRHVE